MIPNASLELEATPSEAATLKGLELHIVRDPCGDVAKEAVRVFGVEGGDIGRSPDSYWVLPDPMNFISGHHCTIEFDQGVYWVRDHSRNGVFRNGATEPVGHGRRVPLCSGDRLRIAEYELVVNIENPNQAFSDEAAAATRLVGTGDHASVGEPPAEVVAVAGGSGELAHAASPGLVTAMPDSAPQPSPDDAAHRPRALRNLVTGLRARVDNLISPPTRHVEAASADRPLPEAQVIAPPNYRAVAMDPAEMERHGILVGNQHEAALRAYKMLRTRMHRRLVANKWRSVIVTGEGPGVGKTVTAANLAITFANDPRTPVVLVDLDLHRPQIANYLGLSLDKGLGDYLLGDATIEEIIRLPRPEGLAVIGITRPLGHASELLTSARMLELVHYLEQRLPRHLIFYDMPPLLMSDDVLAFSPHADCILDVVAVGVTRRASLEASREILSELNVIGVVLNRSGGPDTAGYSYYY